MTVLSRTSAWPPRRLPSRLRLIRIRLARRRSHVVLRSVVRHVTRDVLLVLFTGTAFLLIDLYT